MKSEDISRRSFLKRAAALSAAAAIPSFWIPSKSNAMPGVPFVSANEKVRIAFIGIGNRGADIAQDGYSYGVQPDINHYEASKAVTIAGTDIYHPTQDDLTGAEIAFGGDSIRTLKDSSYLVLECQAQAF